MDGVNNAFLMIRGYDYKFILPKKSLLSKEIFP